MKVARDDYLEAYALGTEDIVDAPNSIEHIEQRHASGVWVRIRIDESAEERERVAMAVFGALTHTKGAAEFIAKRTETATGQPTLIACLPNDTIRAVADEIDENESIPIVLVYPDPVNMRDVLWMSGLTRTSSMGQYAQSLDESGLTPDSTIEEMMVASGVTPEALLRGETTSSRPILVPA
ncbi:hypothetical protein C5E45_32935 [Nocardia nova]|uniref:Uncharacterized protein n=1 Tax=Nocardia nova TaxID=37330 RepID=A0A2S6ACT3_9NOCA|nr:hypothetical protein C5E45_32935 [Nocardia nova]